MTKKIMLFAFVCAALAGAGCATTLQVTAGVMVPGAMGEGKATIDSNGNGSFTMEVRHLASPKKLTPPQELYMVWAQTKDGRTMQLGMLNVDEEGEGTFTGTVSAKNFRVVVSAELAATAQQPSGMVVLSTDFIDL